MMHWIGIAITLSSGLLGIELIRRRLQKRWRRISGRIVDWSLVVLLLIGVGTTTAQYYLDQQEMASITEQMDLIALQDVASYNLFGHKSGAWGEIRMVPTPIDDWCRSFVFRSDGKVTWKCDEKSDALCRDVLAKVPNFPFAHFFLAVSKKERGDRSWREDAEVALSIFGKTTRLSSHRSDHDKFLELTREILSSDKE